ncbi:MAG: laccase domain-containing protein [Polaromonas sp.]|nr:laccase domain-containing protein [Polaromonas sp.]
MSGLADSSVPAVSPEGWLRPQWPVPPHVRAVFTTRAGGLSAPPWDSMNLGDHVGDAPADVERNRQRLQEATRARSVFLKQVHGSDVLVLDGQSAHGSTADACVTTETGLACTIMVADCLPVLLSTSDGAVVAAAHAGWRGLAGMPAASPGRAGGGSSSMAARGVLETVHAAVLRAATGLAPRAAYSGGVLAWLGPCIGPSAFEVGAEVKAAFESAQPGASVYFKPQGTGKFLADLPGLARLRLRALGVSAVYGNDGSDAWCTVRNPSLFFSHRRDAGAVATGGNGTGTTGRMAACIWRS